MHVPLPLSLRLVSVVCVRGYSALERRAKKVNSGTKIKGNLPRKRSSQVKVARLFRGLRYEQMADAAKRKGNPNI